MHLRYEGHLRTGADTLDFDLRDLAVVTLPDGGMALYGANGLNGGLTAFGLSATGGLAQALNQLHLRNLTPDAVAGLAATVTIGGTPQVVFGGTGGTGLLSYGLRADGSLGTQETGPALASGTGSISDVASVGIGALDVILVADDGTGRLTAYAGGDGGPYRQMGVQGESTATVLGSGAELATARVGNTTFVLATSHLTGGVGSFEVTATGALRPIADPGAVQGIGIAIPTALETVTAHGSTWVLVGAAGSSSISVMELDATGALHPADHLIDTRDTRFADLQAMTVVQQGDFVLVIAGGSDDGLSLFLLTPSGRLVHLQSLPHTAGSGLENITALTAAVTGDEIQVFVTSGTQGGIAQYDIDLSDLGAVLRDTANGAATLTGTAGNDMLTAFGTAGTDTLNGGAGDDTLLGGQGNVDMRGGAGADLFVPGHGDTVTRILDFEPGLDRIDLSGFPMLRNPGQLTVTATATGARIVFGDAVIDVRSAGGRSLSAEDLFPDGFDWADHFPPGLFEGDGDNTGGGGDDTGERTQPDRDQAISGSPGADRLSGGAGNDTIWGGGGNDTLHGGGGNDTLRGGDGDDDLRGGDGNDSLDAGAGNDVMYGGAGDDSLFGFDGDDLLQGEDGRDLLWGGLGNDTLLGGAGNDTLGGAAGDDLLRGGDGADQIWGDLGRDTLWGGAGNDTLGGGAGGDLLYGEAGNDVVWGGDGNDTQYGGDGDDFVGGFSGDDLLYGGDGNDEMWGNVGNDTLRGGDGNDSLGGGAGNDMLRGGAGNDILRGSEGNDTLSGEDGDDWLDGGTGWDTLWGGAGADTFHFSGNYGQDRIADFQPGVDRIHIAQPGLTFGSLFMVPSGAHTAIATTGGVLILVGVDMADLGPGDFLFG